MSARDGFRCVARVARALWVWVALCGACARPPALVPEDRTAHPAAYEAYLLARLALAGDRADEALVHVTIALSVEPDEPDLHVLAVEVLLAGGRVEDATAQAKLVTRRFPGDPRGPALLARAHAALRRAGLAPPGPAGAATTR